jgi:hypothetical protein
MSKIPPPAKLATASTRAGTTKTDSAEHTRLLTLLWSNFDAIIRHLFLIDPAQAPDLTSSSVEKYRNDLAKAIANCRRYQKEPTDQAAGRALARLLNTMGTFRDQEPPAVDPTLLEATVLKRTLAHPLMQDRGHGKPLKQVGFVDAWARVGVPKGVSLSHEPLLFHHLVDCFYLDEEHQPSARDLEGGVLAPPTWRAVTEDVDVMFDIRTTVPPIGQWLRELKTLDALGDPHLTVVVVDQIDEVRRHMLEHEGFLVLDAGSMQTLGVEHRANAGDGPSGRRQRPSEV